MLLPLVGIIVDLILMVYLTKGSLLKEGIWTSCNLLKCCFFLLIFFFLQNWHKGCFHCEVCKMTLNMKNYKGYDKKPYCNA